MYGKSSSKVPFWSFLGGRDMLVPSVIYISPKNLPWNRSQYFFLPAMWRNGGVSWREFSLSPPWISATPRNLEKHPWKQQHLVATKGGGRRPFVATGMGISLFHTSIDIEFICIYNRKIGKGFWTWSSHNLQITWVYLAIFLGQLPTLTRSPKESLRESVLVFNSWVLGGHNLGTLNCHAKRESLGGQALEQWIVEVDK